MRALEELYKKNGEKSGTSCFRFNPLPKGGGKYGTKSGKKI
jgi:hypothetical protein